YVRSRARSGVHGCGLRSRERCYPKTVCRRIRKSDARKFARLQNLAAGNAAGAKARRSAIRTYADGRNAARTYVPRSGNVGERRIGRRRKFAQIGGDDGGMRSSENAGAFG